MLKCVICGFEGMDLSRHLRYVHKMDVDKYKQTYNRIVVDPLIEEKRKKTCKRIYGNPNYKNEEAKKLSNEIYEGGHALSDPKIRKKADKTKKERYGDSNFTNRKKAQQTCIERYGVDNPNKIKGVKEKRIKTLLEKYGKVFNYKKDPVISKEALIEMHYKRKMTLGEIGTKLNMSEVVVSYWMKKHNVTVHKRVVSPVSKEYIKSHDIVKEFLELCKEKDKVLSFSLYGKYTEGKKMSRLKRLFNTGKRYHHLKDRLFEVALKPYMWDDFLKEFE